ncbi:MAG: beta-lactamase family protein [Acidobacteria bacterium]|nr:beta-lactamase family protein [Acidobacteriota bacterium]
MRFAILALCCACAPAQEIRRLDGSTLSFAEADEIAREVLRANAVTGAQLAVIDDGKTVWSRAFGLRRLTPNLPMETSTNIWAASITKSVFATYVLGLAARGEFNLDVPVAKQLIGPLQSFGPYIGKANSLVRDPRWLRVTPRMLMSHTSGLANFAAMEPDKRMHLHFAPGSSYRYSGEGLNLLQFLVEQKMGQPLEVLLQEAVFGPLGMTRTGMIYREEFAENVADRFGSDGQFLAQTKRFPARGAGSMATTIEDLCRYTEALLAGPVLPEIMKPVMRLRSLHQFPLQPNEPEGEEAKRVGLAYGAGWGLLTKTPFGPAFFKEGHGDGAQTYMICFTDRKTCMILLTNSDNGERAFQPLMERIFGNTVTPWEWEGYLFAR